jgi:mRNA-degrading endonuclease toxin of MazEF toxin-antitoxin module
MSSAAVVVVAAAVLVALLIRGSRRPRIAKQSHRSCNPQPGEIWFVSFPYGEDPLQAKDRPVLVVATETRSALVRKITSQDQSRRPHEYDRLPREASGLTKDSWIRKSHDTVLLSSFRRRAGWVTTRV